MSASFFDMMKYVATGIASPDMTAYDKMRALAAFGDGKTQTLTGIPPLSFKANGKPLISWSMLGNGQQTGTPTPYAPIMPEFVGERTGNRNSTVNIAYGTQKNSYYADISIDSDKLSTLISEINALSGDRWMNFSVDNAAFTPNLYISFSDGTPARDLRTPPFKINAGETVSSLIFRGRSDSAEYTGVTITASNFMLNVGDTALPYEPYGYKIPITCAGQTVPVYLGEVETIRRIKKVVFDGTEPWVLSGTIVYIYNTGTENLSPLICTHFPNVANTGMWNGTNWILQVDISRLGMSGREAWITWLAEQYAAGTPVTVWYVLAEPETAIVNEPLAKIGDYADELHSADAGVSIPTVKGQNTLTVDTDLQPSEMSVTGHIKSS